MHYPIINSFSQFFYHVIYVYTCILSLSFHCYSCSVIVIVHVTIVLLIAVFSHFGYYFYKHLLYYYSSNMRCTTRCFTILIYACGRYTLCAVWRWHYTESRYVNKSMHCPHRMAMWQLTELAAVICASVMSVSMQTSYFTYRMCFARLLNLFIHLFILSFFQSFFFSMPASKKFKTFESFCIYFLLLT